VKKFEDTITRIDRIHECDGQIDGRTERHRMRRRIASRGKNATDTVDFTRLTTFYTVKQYWCTGWSKKPTTLVLGITSSVLIYF